MEKLIITVEEYKAIMQRFDSLEKKIDTNSSQLPVLFDQVSLQEYLHISKRTLSSYRAACPPIIEYSICGGKIYYTQQAVEDFLERHRVKRPSK